MFSKLKKPIFTLIASLGLVSASYALEPFKGGVAQSTYVDEASVHTFKDGKFEWKSGDEVLVAGTYQVHGKYIVFTDVSGPRACIVEGEQIEVGIYEWETWENKHYLAVVEDECWGRQRGFLTLSIKPE